MATRPEYEKVYIASIVFAMVILAANLYYYCHPLLAASHLTFPPLDYIIIGFRHAGIFRSPYRTKLAVLLLLLLSTIVRSGKGRKVDPRVLVTAGLASAAAYLLPFASPLLYLLFTVSGAAGLVWTFAMVSRLFGSFQEHGNDLRESFPQQEEPVENDWSVNLPTRYYWQGRWHDGCISVVNPFRGTLIVGSAGAGKSFSVFNPYIEQMIAKGYTMMLYDFKMPDLSKVVYNALLEHQDSYGGVKPEFFCINFKDPMRSNRCNPIAPRYLTDIIDASETAQVMMEALNKGNEKKDFFWMSAGQYIGICIHFLRIYAPPGGMPGDWCDIPHLIELVNQDYSKVLHMVRLYPSLDGKARVFLDALDANAQDQLQGQIASARIPLNDIASPLLYWVLSGDDFDLDINDPRRPKVLCIGNDPDRQKVYGAALSLFTFRVIKRVNKPGRLPCAIVLDELPTISVNGLDGLMATARSNKVAVVLGIQDLSQVIADYGDKTAEKILSLPANVFVGASSEKTAEKYSKEIGREFRRQESQTRSADSESVNISYHEEEVMPIRKITTLPQGTFVGKVAVDNGVPIEQPFFCGAIQIDMDAYRERQKRAVPMPVLTDFGSDEIREQLRDPEVLRITLESYCMEMAIEEFRDSGASQSEVCERAVRLQDELSGLDDAALVERMLPVLHRKEMERRLQDNFFRIKGEIRNMVEEECPELPEDDEEIEE